MNAKTPFAATRNCKEFMHELMQNIVNQYGKKVTELMPRENIQSFYHGMNWSFQQENRAGFTTQRGELQKQQTTVHLGPNATMSGEEDRQDVNLSVDVEHSAHYPLNCH